MFCDSGQTVVVLIRKAIWVVKTEPWRFLWQCGPYILQKGDIALIWFSESSLKYWWSKWNGQLLALESIKMALSMKACILAFNGKTESLFFTYYAILVWGLSGQYIKVYVFWTDHVIFTCSRVNNDKIINTSFSIIWISYRALISRSTFWAYNIIFIRWTTNCFFNVFF